MSDFEALFLRITVLSATTMALFTVVFHEPLGEIALIVLMGIINAVLFEKLAIKLCQAIVRFMRGLYKLLLSPLVLDYKAREDNYREIIKGLQKHLNDDSDHEALSEILRHMEESGQPLYDWLGVTGSVNGLKTNDPRVSVHPSGSAWAEQNWMNDPMIVANQYGKHPVEVATEGYTRSEWAKANDRD